MTEASEKHILVVDDEPDVRNFLAKVIMNKGFEVATAIDGIDALEKVQEQTPDLITLDMVMPRSSGVNFMRKLRKNPEWASIPVIVITAHARDEFGHEYMKEFMAYAEHVRPKHILEKPITPESIVNYICDILDVDAATPKKGEFMNKKEEIIKMLEKTDEATLKKISSVLKRE